MNKRALESLVKCGALDSTGATRKAMHDVLEDALGCGARHQADRLAGQSSIFDLGGDEAEAGPPRHHRPLSRRGVGEAAAARLREGVARPLRLRASARQRQGGASAEGRLPGLGRARARRDGEIVTVGGIVGAIKALTTKKGEPMVFLRLDDLSGSVETVVFNSVYSAARELLEPDRVLVVKGRVDHKQEGETKLIALEVAPFEGTPEKTEVRLKVDARRAPAGLIRELADLTRRYPGETAVVVAIETSDGPQTYAFGPTFRVKPESDFYAEVKALLGEAAIA